MSTMHLELFQNEYLPEGGREVNAVITVTATGAGADVPVTDGNGEAAEVIVVDVSGSMGGAKLHQALEATAAAIATLRDGVHFAVVAGNHEAWVVYPQQAPLAVASAATRAEATAALRGVRADGGTAIGKWVELATQLFRGYSGARHAILLTDGKDEHEQPADLARALAGAKGVYQCDCRGVGTNWVVSELRTVADALLGTVDIVADPANLAADFTAIMTEAMGRQISRVALRVWSPQGSEVEFVKQVAPDMLDLTDSRQPVNALAGDYPTGAWGNESRDYHVCIRVPQGGLGDEMLAARVTLMVDDESAGQALVRAVWTDDLALSTKLNRQVAHYSGQAELADAIQAGLEARRRGDEEVATARLGRAVQLAEQSGNTDTAKLLSKVVDIDDAATGRVRLRSGVEEADEMTLDTRSTKTVRVRK